MDLSTITDVEKLKAMAYDQIVIKERAESNIRLINQRIQEQRIQEIMQSETKDDAENSDFQKAV